MYDLIPEEGDWLHHTIKGYARVDRIEIRGKFETVHKVWLKPNWSNEHGKDPGYHWFEIGSPLSREIRRARASEIVTAKLLRNV